METSAIGTRLRQRVEEVRAELAQLEEALAGLEKAEALARKLFPERQPASVAASTNGRSQTLGDALWTLISRRPTVFTAPELFKEVTAKWPDDFGTVHPASVSSKVRDFEKKGRIRELTPAGGSKPATYAGPAYSRGGDASEAEDEGLMR